MHRVRRFLNNKPPSGWLINLCRSGGARRDAGIPKTELAPKDLDAIVAYLKALPHHKASPQATTVTARR